jgi:exopolyphosphatase/guanosine-5'-triphosphate,3'-diphosphate pyrophosphatase
MPVFAAVDIGSNSVRLKIADLHGGRLNSIHEDREVTRLGAGVFAGGALDPEAMSATVRVLERFYRAVQKHSAERVRVVATSAVRDSRNSGAFLDWVRSAVGWRVEVITGLEEGRLIHLGVVSSLPLARRRAMLFDLGGGSCEITISDHGHIREMFSLPLGAVRLTHEFLFSDPPKMVQLRRMRDYIAEEMHRVAGPIREHEVDVAIATSGTAAALAEAAGGKGKAADVVSRAATVALAEELAEMPLRDRQKVSGIGPKRAEIIVAGSAVFAELLSHYGLNEFHYSPLGLRDGLLAQMAAEADAHTPQRRQLESEREDALVNLGRRYHTDLKHGTRVRELALELFDELRELHQLSGEWRDLLGAAAMLHEVGYFVNRAGRHRHTWYLITHSEMFGYTQQQRRAIAAVARYMGKSRPALADRELKPLTTRERDAVPMLVCLLRLSRALNQGRRGSVQMVQGRVKPEQVLLRMAGDAKRMELERWAAEKETGFFQEVFGKPLVIEGAA